MTDSEFEQEQTQAAAAQAGAIGGQPSAGSPDEGERPDPAQASLIEAGQSEAGA